MMSDTDFAFLVAELASEGMYEPGQYTKAHQLSTNALSLDEGKISFEVTSNKPNEDVRRARVTVELI